MFLLGLMPKETNITFSRRLTFPSSRASPPRLTLTFRGGRTKAGGSTLWKLHPVGEAVTSQTEGGAADSRTSFIVLSERNTETDVCYI